MQLKSRLWLFYKLSYESDRSVIDPITGDILLPISTDGISWATHPANLIDSIQDSGDCYIISDLILTNSIAPYA